MKALCSAHPRGHTSQQVCCCIASKCKSTIRIDGCRRTGARPHGNSPFSSLQAKEDEAAKLRSSLAEARQDASNQRGLAQTYHSALQTAQQNLLEMEQLRATNMAQASEKDCLRMESVRLKAQVSW